jgi:serine/threonine protein kinase
MGKETSYKRRVRAGLPDSFVGRKAVDLGLITSDQLHDVIDQLPEDAFLEDAETALAAALVTCGLLTQMQVDALLESNPPVRDLGKYRLGRKLGRGGMGIVFEAEDRQLGRRVALKMLRTMTDADPDEMAEDEERFVREGRLAAQLPKHPNIVSVYEAGDIKARRYIAMELIRGDQFHEWRRRKGVPLRLKVSVLRDVARAVDHAHRHGVIHRDLKPANILVDRDNIPHVTDFGLAKQMDRQAGGSLTCSGSFWAPRPTRARNRPRDSARSTDAPTSGPSG